nr:NADH dehydrogenase subunit 6 [Yangida basnetti]
MKLTFMKMMIITSSSTLIMNNPMSMGLTLLVQTMMMILLMNKMLSSSWFVMITFMMMIGGLLIMFMYMSSIASNEKFKLNVNWTLMMVIMIIITDEMMLENQINELLDVSFKEFNLSLTKIYNIKSMTLTILLVMYLLLTMISVTKLVKHHKGPLRVMN